MGAAHQRNRHRCHRSGESLAAPQTAAPSVTERMGQPPLLPRLPPILASRQLRELAGFGCQIAPL